MIDGAKISTFLWLCFSVFIGILVAFSATSSPTFCKEFLSFCDSRWGFWPIGIGGAVMIFGFVDLLSLYFFVVVPQRFSNANLFRLRGAMLQSIIGGCFFSYFILRGFLREW